MAQRISPEKLAQNVERAKVRAATNLTKKIAKLQAELEVKIQAAHQLEVVKASYKFGEALIKEAGIKVCGGLVDAVESVFIRYLDDRSKKLYVYGKNFAAEDKEEFNNFYNDPATNFALDMQFALPMVRGAYGSWVAQTNERLEIKNKKALADKMEVVLQKNSITYLRAGTSLLVQL